MIRHVFTFLLLGFLPAAFAQNPRPNIVLILADDMGYSDIGSYGGEIETPALDRLATDGVRFRNFYNTARCSTSRAALLTGLYPWQAGVGLLDEDLGAPGYQGFLNQQCVTIAEILGEAGYHTSIAGKWHIGKERPNWPIDRGFQRQFTSPSGGGYYFRPVQPQIGARTIYLDENPLSESALDTWDGDPDPFYSTDDFTDAAILFIDEAVSENKPFLVYLPFIAPHWPLEAPEAEVSKYLTSGLYDNGWGPVRTARLAKQKGPDGIAEALNGSDEEWELSADSVNWSPNSDAIQRMAVHAAVVDRMDQNIARLIDHLENTLGILDNTLIIFVSDNGASSDGGDVGTGSLGNPVGGTNSVDIRYGKGWANASDTPFRGYKKYTENGGIMTPFILHWPDGITRPGGSVLGKRAHLIDVMPTLLEVTGISYPETFNGNSLLPMEGESFADLLTPGGLETRSTPLYFSHETRSGILDGDWKGVAQDDPLHDPFEVYDLSKDPSELNNVAAEEPGIQAALRDAWFVWAHRANVKDWPISSLPNIQLSPRNQTIIRSETTTFSLRRDRSSGSNTVSLSYEGTAKEGVDYSPLPAEVSLSG
ncbi:MAG: sulfatase-like hydrolase/transferase, partial [Kiritimatiellae bacterium]|nr:sulfatase-like hydrolase/transferase [Kiritimatiellia bacterium]